MYKPLGGIFCIFIDFSVITAVALIQNEINLICTRNPGYIEN